MNLRRSGVDVRRSAYKIRRMARKLTAADVREVSGYSRNELRAVLDELPHYRKRGGQARVAREFTRHDLIVLSVIYVLETQYGIRRSAIAQIFMPLRTALSGPKRLNREARLLISIVPPVVSYVETTTKCLEGILVSLEVVFDRVDGYLGSHLDGVTDLQGDLKLGPAVISSRKRNRTA